MAHNPVFDALTRFLRSRPVKSSISEKDNMLLNQFREIVARQKANPDFTTEDAAASLGLSRMHLNRKLRALTGRSTHDYILEERLDAAHAMLSQPLPIEFIAQSVGFKSSSHFAKAFRQKYGITPSDFRAKQSLPRQPTGESDRQ